MPFSMENSRTLVRMERARSLGTHELDHVREAIRRLIEQEGSQIAAARKLGVSQPTLSNALSGLRPPGVGLARRLADALGLQLDALLSGRPTTTREDNLPRLDRIPGYAEVEAAARARAPYLPAVAWEKTRAMSGAALADLTPELLVGFASTWAQVAAGRLRELPPDEGTKPPPVTKKR